MKQTQQIAEGTHFSALSTGSFSQLNDYVSPVRYSQARTYSTIIKRFK